MKDRAKKQRYGKAERDQFGRQGRSMSDDRGTRDSYESKPYRSSESSRGNFGPYESNPYRSSEANRDDLDSSDSNPYRSATSNRYRSMEESYPESESRYRRGFSQRYGGAPWDAEENQDRFQKERSELYRPENFGRYDMEAYGSYGGGQNRRFEQDEDQRSFGERMMDKTRNFFGKGPKGYKRSDERIKEDVSECLYNSDEIDASEIEIKVENGEVTLTGSVESRRVKRLVEEAIEDVRGVEDIHNNLSLGYAQRSSEGGAKSGKEPSESFSSTRYEGASTPRSSKNTSHTTQPIQ